VEVLSQVLKMNEAEIQGKYGWNTIRVKDETKERIKNLQREGDSYNDMIERMLNYAEEKNPILSISTGDKLSVHLIPESRLKLETEKGIYELDQSKDIKDINEIKNLKFSFKDAHLFVEKKLWRFRSFIEVKITGVK
jgi:predicted CopG family antitoxin